MSVMISLFIEVVRRFFPWLKVSADFSLDWSCLLISCLIYWFLQCYNSFQNRLSTVRHGRIWPHHRKRIRADYQANDSARKNPVWFQFWFRQPALWRRAKEDGYVRRVLSGSSGLPRRACGAGVQEVRYEKDGSHHLDGLHRHHAELQIAPSVGGRQEEPRCRCCLRARRS